MNGHNMKAIVSKNANIADDECYYIARYGVRSSMKFIGEDIEQARAEVQKMGKRDAKNGSLARYVIENGYAQEIEIYFTVDLIEQEVA